MKPHRTIIEPPKKLSLRLAEIWQYRELFYFFTWRDIKVKYKQTYLGVLWAVIQPLALMALFTLVFARRLPAANTSLSYPLFVLSGLVVWTVFYNATAGAAESILQQASVLKKIYFPRLVVIGSALLTALFDFLIAFALFLVVALVMHQAFSWMAIFFFSAGVAVVLLAAFGAGALLAALNVQYRDFRYALPFLLQFLFFASQVVYSLQDATPWVKNVLSLNPVNSAIELFRGALGERTDIQVVLTGSGVAVLLAFLGAFHFTKTEAHFADLA